MPPALGYRIEKEQQSGCRGLGLLRFARNDSSLLQLLHMKKIKLLTNKVVM